MKKQKPNLQTFAQIAFWEANPAKTFLAYVLFSIGCVGGIGYASLELHDAYKNEGLDTYEALKKMDAKEKFYLLMEIILPFIVFAGSAKQLVNKNKEYAAAEYIVKRKLRKFAKTHPELKKVEDSEVLQSIADLIIANMTESEKTQLIACIHSHVYIMREYDGEPEMQKKFTVTTMSLIEDIAKAVFRRNPELKDTVIDIALGKTTFAPLVMRNQKNR